MAVTPLTPAQRTAVGALVASGWLAVVPPDISRAQAFIRQADDALEDVPRLTTKTQTQYNLAYDACHDVGEASQAAQLGTFLLDARDHSVRSSSPAPCPQRL